MPRQHNNISVYRKRKLVLQQAQSVFPLPDEKLKLFKLGKSVGANVYQAFFPNGEETLLSMPTKFRDTIYVIYGMFALAECVLENNKIWGEIQHILFPEQISNIQSNKLWPKEFEIKDDKKKENESYISEDLMPNISDSDSCQSSSEVDSDEDEEEDEDEEVSDNQ